MAAALQASALVALLRNLPKPLLAVLDGWSYRIARRKARRRRDLARKRKA